MEYTKDEDGNITQVITPEVVEHFIEKPDVHAEYLVKKRGDIIQDIEIRQQELADLEAEIKSFNKVAGVELQISTVEPIEQPIIK